MPQPPKTLDNHNTYKKYKILLNIRYILLITEVMKAQKLLSLG